MIAEERMLLLAHQESLFIVASFVQNNFTTYAMVIYCLFTPSIKIHIKTECKTKQ